MTDKRVPTDDEIIAVRRATNRPDYTKPFADTIAFGRALLDLYAAPVCRALIAAEERESHQRIVRGEGTPEDYLRVVGDPRQSVGMPCEASAMTDKRVPGVCCMKCGGDILVGPALCAGCAPDLVAERDALKAALRARVILTSEYRDEDGDVQVDFFECQQCYTRWNEGESERHAEGCLAAPEDAP